MSVIYNNIGTLKMTGCQIKCDTLFGTNITNFIENPTITTSYTHYSEKAKTLWGGVSISTHLEKSQITPTIFSVKNEINIKAQYIILTSVQALSKEGSIRISSTNVNFGATKVSDDITPLINKKRLVTALTTGTQEHAMTVSLIAPNGSVNVESDHIAGVAPKTISKKVLMVSKNKINFAALILQQKTHTSANGICGIGFVKSKTDKLNESALVPFCKSDGTNLRATYDIKLISPIFVSENKITIESTEEGITIEPVILHNWTQTTNTTIGIVGLGAVGSLIEGNIKQMSRDVLNSCPLGAVLDVAESKDTADLCANSIKTAHQSYKAYDAYCKGNLKEQIIQKLLPDSKILCEQTITIDESTNIIKPILNAPEINLKAKKDINLTGIKADYTTINIESNENVNIGSAITTRNVNSETIAVTVGYDSFGMDIGSSSRCEINHHNSSLIGTNTNIRGKNISLRGMNIVTLNALFEAETLRLETLQSLMVQDSIKQGFSVSSKSVSLMMADGLAKKRWTDVQTEIKCTENLIMRISKEINIIGGKIIGKGTIDCPKITHQNVINTFNLENVSIGVSISKDDMTIDADYKSVKKEMIDRATIDKNIIIITQSDIFELSRDTENSRIETINEKSHYRAYVPIQFDKNDSNDKKIDSDEEAIHDKPVPDKAIPQKKRLSSNNQKKQTIKQTKDVSPNKEVSGIHYVKGGDHAFVVIGKGKNSVACDPWDGKTFPVLENSIKLHDMKEGRYISPLYKTEKSIDKLSHTATNIIPPKAYASVTIRPNGIGATMTYDKIVIDQRSIGYKTEKTVNSVGISNIYPASLYFSHKEVTNKKESISAELHTYDSEVIGPCISTRTITETVGPHSTSVTVENHVNTVCIAGSAVGSTLIVGTMGTVIPLIAVPFLSPVF